MTAMSNLKINLGQVSSANTNQQGFQGINGQGVDNTAQGQSVNFDPFGMSELTFNLEVRSLIASKYFSFQNQVIYKRLE